jgi:hypothetical protein
MYVAPLRLDFVFFDLDRANEIIAALREESGANNDIRP